MDEQDVMDQEQHDGLVDDEITANENVAPWDWWREEPPEQDDDPGDVMPIENITEITEEEDDLPTHPSSRDDDPEDDITEMTVTPTGDTRDDVTPRAVDPDPTVYAPSPARSRDRPGQGHPDPSATVSGPQDGQHEAPDHQNNPYNSDRRNPR